MENIINKIFKDTGFIKTINKLIRSKEKLISENLCYFIARLSGSLENEFGIKKDCLLKRGDKMSFSELLVFQENINKPIFYKGLMSASFSEAIATCYARTHGNKEKDYSVIITINFKYRNNWIPCLDISSVSNYEEQQKVLIEAFSCFIIKEVIIKEKDKKAKILLELAGKEEIEIIEKKIADELITDLNTKKKRNKYNNEKFNVRIN